MEKESDLETRSSCSDALIHNSKGYVQEAYTANAKFDGAAWCVAASALAPASESERFEKNIKETKAEGKMSVEVSDY